MIFTSPTHYLEAHMLTLAINSVGVVTVLAFQQVDAESGIVLARIDRDDVNDRFVTWRVFESPEFGTVATGGHYFSRLKNYTVVEPVAA
jgi:hypothetical protein